MLCMIFSSMDLQVFFFFFFDFCNYDCVEMVWFSDCVEVMWFWFNKAAISLLRLNRTMECYSPLPAGNISWRHSPILIAAEGEIYSFLW